MDCWNYYTDNKNKLLYKFDGSDRVEKVYSQAGQDLFVLTVLNGKQNGTYVEIGSSWPIENNNTYILENQFNWTGVSFDRNEELNKAFREKRINPVISCDATKINYSEIFKQNNLPNRIDYLQLDIEPAFQTLSALKSIDLEKYRFNVITFETDFYAGGNHEVVYESRKLLQDLGYKLVASNVCHINNPFEDWYVDPQIVDEEKWKLFESDYARYIDLLFKK